MNLRLFIMFALLLAGIAILAIGRGHPFYFENKTDATSYNLHYRVTVTIDTPEGPKSGSVVRAIGNGTPLVRFPGGGNPGGVWGEAVMIDLGDRGRVFALIDDNEDHRFYSAFPPPGRAGGASPPGIAYYATLLPGQMATLNPRKFPGLPRIVTFADLSDPESVASVMYWDRNWGRLDDGSYSLKEDHFEKLFGKGVSFKEMIYEITDAPLTRILSGDLPWIDGLKGGYLDGQFSSRGLTLSNTLHGGDFKQGRGQ